MTKPNRILKITDFASVSSCNGCDGAVLLGAHQQSQLAERICKEIPKTSQACALAFDGVRLMDISFAMKVLVPFKVMTLAMEKALVLKNLAPDILETVEAAIAFHRKKTGSQLCILVQQAGDISPVGYLEPALEKAFRIMCQQGYVKSEDLRRIEPQIRIENAGMRLKRMWNMGTAIRDETIDSYGRSYRYTLPQVS